MFLVRLADQDCGTDATGQPRATDEPIKDLEQARLPGSLDRRGHRQIRRAVERLDHMGVHRPEDNRDQLIDGEDHEPLHKRAQLVQDRDQVPDRRRVGSVRGTHASTGG